MEWVESLQKAIDYIEKHLLEDISIEEIAKEVNFSTFHFQRTFSILTDMSIGEYVRRRRLTLAAHELTRSDKKVIDIAYKYGYDTPEAFAKAFRRQHGISPSEARKHIGKLKSYNRLVIQVNLKGAEPMNVKIVEKEAIQVVGVKRFLWKGRNTRQG